jgi:hypothetical protein
LPEVDLELSVHPARIDVSTDYHRTLELDLPRDSSLESRP